MSKRDGMKLMKEEIKLSLTAYNPEFPNTIILFSNTDATKREEKKVIYEEARQEYFPFLEPI